MIILEESSVAQEKAPENPSSGAGATGGLVTGDGVGNFEGGDGMGGSSGGETGGVAGEPGTALPDPSMHT